MGLFKKVVAAIVTSGGSEDRMVKGVQEALKKNKQERDAWEQKKQKEAEETVKEGVSGLFGSNQDDKK